MLQKDYSIPSLALNTNIGFGNHENQSDSAESEDIHCTCISQIYTIQMVKDWASDTDGLFTA